jgi:hypothetical protein
MPTVLQVGPYRFFFYSADGKEPPHVHIERDADTAKFWLDPVRLAFGAGFSAKELRHLEMLTIQYRDKLLEAWNDYFTT